jgi:hypothetical protein
MLGADAHPRLGPTERSAIRAVEVLASISAQCGFNKAAHYPCMRVRRISSAAISLAVRALHKVGVAA